MARRGNRIELSFPGMQQMQNQLRELNGDLKKVAEKALKESHDYVTPKLHEDMLRHKKTGKTEQSIIDTAKIDWTGTTASVAIGFNLKDGGMPSIFLMRGTPRTRPDTKLRNDVYGPKTKKEIQELQKKTFMDAIAEKMEGG